MKIKLKGFPPTINHAYGRHGNRTYLKKEGKKYKEKMCYICAKYRNSFPKPKRVKIFILLKCSNRRRWDIDNRLKILLDSLEKAKVFENDSQIDSISIERRFNFDNDWTEIELKECFTSGY